MNCYRRRPLSTDHGDENRPYDLLGRYIVYGVVVRNFLPPLTDHWSGRGAAAVTGCGRISLAPIAPAHHHIDLPAAATGADEPSVPIEHRGPGAVALGYLGGVGLDPMLAALAAGDQPDAGAEGLPSVIGEPGEDFNPASLAAQKSPAKEMRQL